MIEQPRSPNLFLAYVLWFFLGGFGAHRFYLGSRAAWLQLLLTLVNTAVLVIALVIFLTGIGEIVPIITGYSFTEFFSLSEDQVMDVTAYIIALSNELTLLETSHTALEDIFTPEQITTLEQTASRFVTAWWTFVVFLVLWATAFLWWVADLVLMPVVASRNR